MKKLVTILLLVLIFIISSFASVRYFANAEETDNWFNNEYRSQFAQYPFFRKIFNLRWDGDAKADYLSSQRFTKLVIEVDKYDECQLDEAVMNQVTTELSRVLDKPDGVEFIASNNFSLPKDSYTRAELRELADEYQHYTGQPNEAVLQLLCLNKNAEEPSYIGLTIHENTVVIFWQAIAELSQNNPETLPDYISSTILHEIGHQLGLDHIEGKDCIMAASVESPGNAAGAINEIPQVFCPAEIEAIEQIANSL